MHRRLITRGYNHCWNCWAFNDSLIAAFWEVARWHPSPSPLPTFVGHFSRMVSSCVRQIALVSLRSSSSWQFATVSVRCIFFSRRSITSSISFLPTLLLLLLLDSRIRAKRYNNRLKWSFGYARVVCAQLVIQFARWSFEYLPMERIIGARPRYCHWHLRGFMIQWSPSNDFVYKSLVIILVDCPFVFDVCLRRRSTLLLSINQLPVIQNSISHSRGAIYTPGKLHVQLRSTLIAVYFPSSGIHSDRCATSNRWRCGCCPIVKTISMAKAKRRKREAANHLQNRRVLSTYKTV